MRGIEHAGAGGSADLSRRFADIHSAVMAELESWDDDHWSKACLVHGVESDGRGLALHIAKRGVRVVAMVEDLSAGRVPGGEQHRPAFEGGERSAEIKEALRSAAERTLRLIDQLSDKEIERLHASDIDGEHDALEASCGLVGHWTFHLTALQQMRG